jgi:nicotinate phosphoribosyltransferase
MNKINKQEVMKELLEKYNFTSVADAINRLKTDFYLVNYLTDNDMYNFTMQQYAYHNAPDTIVEYEFKCRNNIPLAHLQEIIQHQIDHVCTLGFTDHELAHLGSEEVGVFADDYLEALRNFKLNSKYVTLSVDDDGQLAINIKGPWFKTKLFDIIILSIINGVDTIIKAIEGGGVKKFVDEGIKRLGVKLDFIQNHHLGADFKLNEFGVRRRFLGVEYQMLINLEIIERVPESYEGLSNVYLSMVLGVTPKGTMAHEYLQHAQAVVGIENSQVYALEQWLKEYKGKLGIALTDIFGTDAFFVDFRKELAEAYTGGRHDSGCPFEWGDKMIRHYEELDIDPTSKLLVFSDGLDIELAFKLLEHFNGRIQVGFGIGTNLTNDVGITALQIVIKMTVFGGKPVAKVSENAAKIMCRDLEFLVEVQTVVDIKKSKYATLYDKQVA